MTKRAPKPPPTCRQIRFAWPCGARIRAPAEIAAELRTWAPERRAEHFRHEEEYAARYPGTAPSLREVGDLADRYVAYCAEVHLLRAASELDAGLCWSCAYDAAHRSLHLRRLVFEGLLAGFATSGRDERAEEEFELARCAA